jgi:hypothetical protein
MIKSRSALILAVLVVTVFVSGMAFAAGSYQGSGHSGGYYRGGGHYGGSYQGGGHYGGYYRGRGYFGWPYWGLWYDPLNYYPYYYPYYYPPSVAVPSMPEEYIERSQPEPSSTPSGVWYYCPESRTYYPYVKECPGGWQMVPAQPPSEPER